MGEEGRSLRLIHQAKTLDGSHRFYSEFEIEGQIFHMAPASVCMLYMSVISSCYFMLNIHLNSGEAERAELERKMYEFPSQFWEYPSRRGDGTYRCVDQRMGEKEGAPACCKEVVVIQVCSIPHRSCRCTRHSRLDEKRTGYCKSHVPGNQEGHRRGGNGCVFHVTSCSLHRSTSNPCGACLFACRAEHSHFLGTSAFGTGGFIRIGHEAKGFTESACESRNLGRTGGYTILLALPKMLETVCHQLCNNADPDATIASTTFTDHDTIAPHRGRPSSSTSKRNTHQVYHSSVVRSCCDRDVCLPTAPVVGRDTLWPCTSTYKQATH